MTEVFVGVGSNIEPWRNVRHGLQLMRQCFGSLRRSPVYRSRAVGFQGDDFLNLVVGFETAARPADLVETLHAMEAQAGRQRACGGLRSRALDLDLLLYGDEIIEAPALRLPRPEIMEYAFVLKPLAELAGECRHPELGQTFAELWSQFPDSGQILTPVDWEDGGS